MDRETARQTIRKQIRCTDFLEKSKGSQYQCPFCGSGSGSGPQVDGAFTYYSETNTCYCFSCHKYADVIDLYQQENGVDYNTALSLMANELNITIDAYRPGAAEDFAEYAQKPAQEPQSNQNEREGSNTPATANTAQNGTQSATGATAADYTSYYRACRQRLIDAKAGADGRAYLEQRGISLDTAKAYWLGYDPVADPAGKGHPTPRIIIPTTAAHYVGRRIDGNPNFAKMNVNGSHPGIFNHKALLMPEVGEVFITEGVFDALSVIEAGYPAVALNGTGNVKTLVKFLENQGTTATLILCPDNDQKPETKDKVTKAFNELAEGLQRLNISYIRADINGEYKDANEHLTQDKPSFLTALQFAQRQTARRPDNTSYYIDKLMRAEIDRFQADIKTGFSNLDEAQGGGLYSGLYVLAAISSLGKTSFALQMADQIAAGGHDVLYFSLEQSRLELVTKSIARNTVTINPDTGKHDFSYGVKSMQIRKGFWGPTVRAAADRYKDAVKDKVSIIEGNFNCNVTYINEYVRRYMQQNGTKPVIFVDYLQILQPAPVDRKQSTKEAIDNIVTELKRISRSLDLTIIVISSVNRSNYLTPIDFESLKESGGIEYSCDVVWGLQLQCLNEELFSAEKKTKQKRARIKEAKAANPREIELVCLKNRFGISSYSCYYNYFPANDLFIESSGGLEFDSTITL